MPVQWSGYFSDETHFEITNGNTLSLWEKAGLRS